jgi:hypothetical protein
MKIKIGIIGLLLILGANIALAQSKDLGFIIGLGVGVHTFSETDDTRKALVYSGDSSSSDEIKALVGLQFYAEYFLLDYLSLGLKSQSMNGGVDYKYTDFTIERRIKIDNSILYTNLLFPVGDGYWRLGGTGGAGSSKYTVSWEVKCDSGAVGCTNKTLEDSSTGTVIDLGLLADWGEDGFGGRLGYLVSTMSHDEYEDDNGTKTEVKASGSQFFIDVRYSF